jgi:subtilisin family serine protease
LKQYYVKVYGVSRWLNAVIASFPDSMLTQLRALEFVKEIKKVKSYQRKKKETIETGEKNFILKGIYGFTYSPLKQIEIIHLHRNGLFGSGVLIAVFDGGFKNLDEDKRTKIIDKYNFVDGNDSVYHRSVHGTYVYSLLAEDIPFLFKGIAPEADYALYITEDVKQENIIEEYYWVLAAERADSIGADIIQSSLSYTVFDNSNDNHTYQDLDGQTTPIAQAARIAARKGIHVVVSAGNYGNSNWRYIGTPADADSIYAVGACDSNGVRVSFSSVGPSSDGRIKPDLMAMGFRTPVSDGERIFLASGTSFSSPLVAGGIALLINKFPGKFPGEIRNAVLYSANHFSSPDTLYGYGIPNFRVAYQILLNDNSWRENREIPVFPNPFHNVFSISLSNDVSSVNIYDIEGNLVMHKVLSPVYPKFHSVGELLYVSAKDWNKGMYIVQIIKKNGEIYINKILKN